MMEKPVIARINGYCFGAGFELACACDFRFALESASFTMPETKVGIITDVGGTINYRKLSITVQLSDPSDYEGGDLQFLITREPVTAKREKGNAIVFPSFMIHQVKPVTKGVRYSLVCWCSGPAFV